MQKSEKRNQDNRGKQGRLEISIAGLPSDPDTWQNARAIGLAAASDLVFCSRRFHDLLKNNSAIRNKLVCFPDRLSELPRLINARRPAPSGASLAITVLATGDPDFFGITGFLENNFPGEIKGVMPAVSIMQECFGRLGMKWDDAGFFSMHGRSSGGLRAFLLRHHKGFLFTSGGSDVDSLLETLRATTLKDYRIYLFEDLGAKSERMTVITHPYRLKKKVSSLNAVVFIRESRLGSYPGLGLDDSSYQAKKGMITKREIRVNALSLLAFREGNVLWDIGAGSGSLSIEASHNPAGTLAFAIENDRESFGNIEKNINRHGAANVVPVFGDFIKVWKKLPVPDRVFVGGGGRDWQRNLRVSWDRLVPGGVLVVSAVTIESLTGALAFFEQGGISFVLSGISPVRTVPVKAHNILNSQNPVFLLRAEKRLHEPLRTRRKE